jgi:phage terminase large subunit-like protein
MPASTSTIGASKSIHPQILEVRQHYAQLMTLLNRLDPSERVLQLRSLIRTDLYYLLRYVMLRKDMEHPWLLARIREIQTKPDGHLDLWARDHRKSTIITFAKTIQDILASHGDDPLPEWDGIEPTFCILSHTRPTAKAFLRQIKDELAGNATLKALFPDVLFARPDVEALRWSEESGLVVKRKTNPKEATLEAYGLVDGQPTGRHFFVLIYDDVVTLDSVNTPEMIQKTTEAWELSSNIGTADTRVRMIGTRYHFNDTWRAILEKGSAIPRLYPATEDGTPRGKPVLLTQEQLDKKFRDQGPYVFSSQMLLNPIADSKQCFERRWFENRFRPLDVGWQAMNRCLLVDPANSKKKDSDYTAMAVLGMSDDGNVYLLDFFQDRLSLTERTLELFRLHRLWKPQYVGYEEYGLQADIQHIKLEQDRKPYHFGITELGGKLSKVDRIQRLIPVCSTGQLWLPESVYRTQHDGKTVEVIGQLIEQQFLAFPVPVYFDGMDVISRYLDVPGFGAPESPESKRPDDRYNKKRSRTSWMSA